MKSVLRFFLFLSLAVAVNTAFAAKISLKPAEVKMNREPHAAVTIKPMEVHVQPLIAAVKPELSEPRREYSFRERVIQKILRAKLRKMGPGDGQPVDPKKLKLGRLALILGAGAFVAVFIPIVGILSVPMAITGIVLGIISVKGNRNVPGILGIVFGGAFLLLLVVAIAVIIVAFSGF